MNVPYTTPQTRIYFAPYRPAPAAPATLEDHLVNTPPLERWVDVYMWDEADSYGFCSYAGRVTDATELPSPSRTPATLLYGPNGRPHSHREAAQLLTPEVMCERKRCSILCLVLSFKQRFAVPRP